VDRNSIRSHRAEFRLRANVGVRRENANPRSRPTVRLGYFPGGLYAPATLAAFSAMPLNSLDAGGWSSLGALIQSQG
jgi:hypothetical protein